MKTTLKRELKILLLLSPFAIALNFISCGHEPVCHLEIYPKDVTVEPGQQVQFTTKEICE